MRLLIIALLLGAALVGCATAPPPQTVTKYKYVIVQIPDKMLELPPPVPDIDTSTATDKDAAEWLLSKEERVRILEKMLSAIKALQDNRLKTLNVPPEDIVQ